MQIAEILNGTCFVVMQKVWNTVKRRENEIMLERIWRYSVNEDEAGGIVLAAVKEEAESKVRNKYSGWSGMDCTGEAEIKVWNASCGDGYSAKDPDVIEVY